MKKYKTTEEQREQVRLRAKTMPVFPKTDKNGKPLLFARWLTGKEIKGGKIVKNLTVTPAMRKAMKDNQKYGPFYGMEDRDPYKYLMAGLPNGDFGLADAYKRYMHEYNLYQQLLVKNNTKFIEDKNISNEKNETDLPESTSSTDPVDEL